MTNEAHTDNSASDGDALRRQLRDVASPVVVVNVLGDRGLDGATIGSFASVSLDPPMVSFNVSVGSALHRAMTRADRVAVQLLSDRQADVALAFSLPNANGADKLASVPHSIGDDGLPRFEGSVGTLSCTTVSLVEAGDSVVVIATVDSVASGRADAPLLYYQRKYVGVDRLSP